MTGILAGDKVPSSIKQSMEPSASLAFPCFHYFAASHCALPGALQDLDMGRCICTSESSSGQRPALLQGQHRSTPGGADAGL